MVCTSFLLLAFTCFFASCYSPVTANGTDADPDREPVPRSRTITFLLVGAFALLLAFAVQL